MIRTSFAGVFAAVLLLAGCVWGGDGGSENPTLTPAATATGDLPTGPDMEDVLMRARLAAGGVESYRYTMEMRGWQERLGEERAESNVRYSGEWVASGDFHVVEAVLTAQPGSGPPAVEYVSVDGRYFERAGGARGTWQQIVFPPGSGVPRALVPDADRWELVDADASMEFASAYQLRGTSNGTLAMTGKSMIVRTTYDLWVVKDSMLPWQLETYQHVLIEAEGGAVEEETETVYTVRFYDFNVPQGIEPPADPVMLPGQELPAPNAPEETSGITVGDWQPFLMVYELKRWPATVHRLEWRGDQDWRDEIIQTPQGAPNRNGTWRRLLGTTYADFDAITGRSREQEVDGAAIGPVSRQAHEVMFQALQEQYGIIPDQITHEGTEVCYLHACSTRVPALRFGPEGTPIVYTMDGIPLETPVMRVLYLHLPAR